MVDEDRQAAEWGGVAGKFLEVAKAAIASIEGYLRHNECAAAAGAFYSNRDVEDRAVGRHREGKPHVALSSAAIKALRSVEIGVDVAGSSTNIGKTYGVAIGQIAQIDSGGAFVISGGLRLG